MHVSDEVLWRKDLTSIPVEYWSDPIRKNGEVTGAVVNFLDITDRKFANDQVNISLVEKERLIQEIHHRNNNNLQVIASTLARQASTEARDRIREALPESQHEAGVAETIHDGPHQSDNRNAINANHYLNTLAEDVRISIGKDSQHISIHVDAKEVLIDLEQAIPCGQIVRELMINSILYAFPDGRSGNVEVVLRRTGDAMIELTVADDGKGMPGDFDLEQADSLGLKLVHVLTKQLNGTINIDGSNGTRFQIMFPDASS